MNSFEKLKELLAATETDAKAFYEKGNKAAAGAIYPGSFFKNLRKERFAVLLLFNLAFDFFFS